MTIITGLVAAEIKLLSRPHKTLTGHSRYPEPVEEIVESYSRKMAKRVMKCAHCGSSEVRKDAWAAWDLHAQQWEVAAIYDHVYCLDCDAETTIVEEEVGDALAPPP